MPARTAATTSLAPAGVCAASQACAVVEAASEAGPRTAARRHALSHARTVKRSRRSICCTRAAVSAAVRVARSPTIDWLVSTAIT